LLKSYVSMGNMEIKHLIKIKYMQPLIICIG
jgi:hypothetical protein